MPRSALSFLVAIVFSLLSLSAAQYNGRYAYYNNYGSGYGGYPYNYHSAYQGNSVGYRPNLFGGLSYVRDPSVGQPAVQFIWHENDK
ncbi:hypothetical protein AAVH_30939 [Aphelenchoides avenae]|nr:hypothetical protein AAVH_30939 [Aphelenchus avenae]